MAKIARVVALGASNLARGIGTLVNSACAAWGPDVEVLVAPGYGRSYGARSRVAFRTLPGILESGLWRALDSLPPVSTKVLITDVGNDILYGFSIDTILAWIDDALHRLRRITSDITLTGLPLESIRQLSPAKYLVFRSILFPGCRTSLDQLMESTEKLNAGLAVLSTELDARFYTPSPDWYGVDPIHIRRRFWPLAWSEMLGSDPSAMNAQKLYLIDRLRLRFLRPEQRWLFGFEQFARQSGYSLSSGVRIWLF
jgi:hypothetical protein